VEELACQQPQFGERLPCRWLYCDQSLERLTLSGLNFCSVAQVTYFLNVASVCNGSKIDKLVFTKFGACYQPSLHLPEHVSAESNTDYFRRLM